MKQFIKNNLKFFVTIIITTIIVGSVSVYAASQYFAKDINFIPTNENFKKENGEAITNVEDALNELYSKENKYNSVNFNIYYHTGSIAQISIYSLQKVYSKISLTGGNGNVESTKIGFTNSSNVIVENIELGKVYDLNELINKGAVNLIIFDVPSKSVTNGWKAYNVVFSN